MMTTDPQETRIEELGLSADNIQLVHRAGITSIGNCIDFFERGHRCG